jgi:hypothetical protein
MSTEFFRVVILKMEAICSFETLVTTYKTTQHHNPEDHNQDLYHYFNTVFGRSNFKK